MESGVRQFKEGMEGIIEGRVESFHALMVNLHLSAEQAMESIGIPKSEFEKYKQML